MKIRKGDKVIIIKGKDKGKSSKVVKAMPAKEMIVVEGLNLRKKTINPRKQGERGQVVDVPWPMRVSNVMFVCDSCGKPTRIGHKKDKDGDKVRYCKKCKATV